jgi:hypothetical protein
MVYFDDIPQFPLLLRGDNRLTRLPQELRQLISLTTLDLKGNPNSKYIPFNRPSFSIANHLHP